MRIGMVGSIWLNTPPKGYGGTEDVVFNTVNGLREKGYEVSFFGPKTAQISVPVIPTVEKPLREMQIGWDNVGYTLLHITEAFDRANEFDLLHVHLNKSQDFIALPLSLNCKTPVLFTLHFNIPDFEDQQRRDRYLLLKKYASLPYTAISNSQRKPIKLNYISTIYNAIDLNRFPFSNRKGTYLTWLGRVSPSKGTKEAILVAKKAGIKIFLMGNVDWRLKEVTEYFEKEVKPLIDDDQVIWLGEVSHVEKTSILSGSIALINPIQWEEPFGLVMVESQAVGTPVIAFDRGAAAEIIREGETGFLVNTIEEMVEKVKIVASLDRKACKLNVEKRFTVDKMVQGYENAYKKTIANWTSYSK